MAYGWVFWQWISTRLSLSFPSKQHANKQCSSMFAWAGCPRLGTNWLSQTQLSLDTTTLICSLALEVVQWPPLPFLPSFSFASSLREREDREEKREMTWCLPPMLKLLFPGPQLSLPAAFILRCGICRSWPLDRLSLGVAGVSHCAPAGPS